jgi:hypothetical protein
LTHFWLINNVINLSSCSHKWVINESLIISLWLLFSHHDTTPSSKSVFIVWYHCTASNQTNSSPGQANSKSLQSLQVSCCLSHPLESPPSLQCDWPGHPCSTTRSISIASRTCCCSMTRRNLLAVRGNQAMNDTSNQ